MPKGRAHHVLDGAFLPVGELHFHLLLFLADARQLPADLARLFRTLARGLATLGARLRRRHFASAGILPALAARLVCLRWTIPLRVLEFQVRLHEVVDGEVILAVVEPGAATYDLLELDHRVDRAHQHDVTDVSSIDAGGELL